MNSTQFTQKLKALNACSDAKQFASNKSLEEVWNTCSRGDWMLWLAKKADIDLRILTKAKALCANTVRHLMKDERSKNAIDVAIKFGNGIATLEELNTAAYAASVAASAAYAAYAAAAYAAYAAAYAAYAAYAAADTAAFADAAVDAAFAVDNAKKENQLLTAQIVREQIPFSLILKHLTKP